VLNPERFSGLLCIAHSRSNSTKSPPSGAGNVSEPRHVTSWNSARSYVRIDQCVYASRAVDVPIVSVCVRSICIYVSGQEDLKTRAEGCRTKCQGLCGFNCAINMSLRAVSSDMY